MAAQRTRHATGPLVRGRWTAPERTATISDLADGGTFETVHLAGVDDVERALTAADAARTELRETTIPERANWCHEIADGIRERKSDFVETIVREAGKPISSARGEVESAAERFDRAAEEIRHLKGEYREGTTDGHEDWEALVKFEPIGTVVCISPYNYPLATTALQVAPALATGNSVLLKPALKTPVSAAMLAEVLDDVDLPEGTFNFLPGRGSEIGDALVGDDRVDAVAMTGSSGAGKRVADQSGIANLHLELGGNAPAIVFSDADLTDVADQCAKGSFKYAGQRCSAVSRILAHEDVHDDLVSDLEDRVPEWQPDDLFEESTRVGPLIDESQAEWVDELVTDAVDRGANLVCGGERDGTVYEPTLLSEIPHDARILREEQFGPVAAVTEVESESAALELANESDLTLDGCVFTSDYDRATSVANRLEAGAVRINGVPSHGLGDIPFGGNGKSGIGREGLGVTIREFVRRKSVIL
ncbi:aldehyde dehydrogenase family protein [Halobacterium noricense]|uniref:aldehyde dehydrogenase family protein n=1 Tax=Halobacterium noricense TaxID=223182 RepID=UPI001E4FA6E4|nr:aldehyde dehydrogenase family protein [Halobacterium noricense]UHH24282.1 aldehyde dehydrogenase family protein [Halobacterium noricense]